jgi:molybdenum cofactor biosynthesis protein MoaC
VRATASTIERLKANRTSKADVLVVARVAAISAAKQTSSLIPYCHPVPVEFAEVTFEIAADAVEITARVETVARTGVEMEALTAVSVAALTIYDMLKPDDDALLIEAIRLESKRGGRSDTGRAAVRPGFTASVLVASDSAARGMREDTSGLAAVERLRAFGIEATRTIVPDDRDRIASALRELADRGVDLVFTTGGTGLGPRDVTAEVTRELIEREVPGIAEAARGHGQARTPFAMLSRGVAGTRGRTLIINLPGARDAVEDALDALLPGVLHAAGMLRGEGH